MRTALKSLTVLFFSILPLAGQAQESLLIGPGDQLHVQIFDTPELEQHPRVTDSGELKLVLGGTVKVSGMSAAEAAQVIELTLKDKQILNNPQVLVTVEDYATEKVSVLGEVRSPGAFDLRTPRSILDVLALAGGLTDLADRHILIERKGNMQKLPYFVSNEPSTAIDTAVTVNPGDTVLVPKAHIVYVLGDVRLPGGYTMTNNEAQLSVLQLVARAGGTNNTAVPSHARLIRKSGGGYVEQPLPLSAIQKGNHADLQLQPDDIVYVPFSYLRSFAVTGASSAVSSVGSAAVYRF